MPAEATVHLTYTDVAGRFADGTPYTLQAPTYELVAPAFGPLPAGLYAGRSLIEGVPASRHTLHAERYTADAIVSAQHLHGRSDGVSHDATRESLQR